MSFDYLNQSRDLALLASNPQMTGGLQFMQGKTLIAASDCKSCHAIDKPNIGPAYIDVAKRYFRVTDAPEKLTLKVLQGGNGNWGKNMMSAHPQHTKEEAMQMVKYILSLNSKQNIALPLQGTFSTNKHAPGEEKGVYVIRASYADKGQPPVGSLSENLLLKLRNPKIQAEAFDVLEGVNRKTSDDGNLNLIAGVENGGYIGLKNTDLTGIRMLSFSGRSLQDGSRVEIRLDAPAGKLIGTASVTAGGNEKAMNVFSTSIEQTSGEHDVYLVFRNDKIRNNLLVLDWVYFDNKMKMQASR